MTNSLRFALVALSAFIVMQASAQGDCIYPNQYPSTGIVAPVAGQSQVISTCNNFGEYARITNVIAGSTYAFTVTGNGYITLRWGTSPGPVVAQGYSPLLYTASDAQNLYPHFSADSTCATGTTCQTTTIEQVNSCMTPVATFATVVDCNTNTFSVLVTVSALGDAAAVDIANNGGAATIAGVGIGSYTVGPFGTAQTVTMTVADAANTLCQIGSLPLSEDPCLLVPVVCGDPALYQSYCYGPNDSVTWTYTGGGDAMRLRFIRGTIEHVIYDGLLIHDGTDATGPILFSHTGQSCNLGPAGSAIASPLACSQSVDVYAASGSIHMVMWSDASVQCTPNQNGLNVFDPWEWEVSCGDVVQASVFLDEDLDCASSTGDMPIPQVIVEVLPGPHYATTNGSGDCYLMLAPGNYTAEQQNPFVADHCNASPQAFTVVDGQSTVLLFPDTAALPLDMEVLLTCGAARVGFQQQVSILVRNLSAQPSGNVQLELEIDVILTYTNAIPAPDQIAGNTLTWDLAPFAPFEQRTVQVWLQVPADVGLIGTDVENYANIEAGPEDSNLYNDAAACTREITAAYDPNNKTARTSTTGSSSQWTIDEDEWIDYTIRFQNTGNDTAFTVIITDTLQASLDPGSVQMGAGSHHFSWDLVGPGILRFMFPNILLPDSNVNEPASHGHVGFRIRPVLPIASGALIENTANIYFDFNPPVITEPSVLTAEFSTGVEEQRRSELVLAPVPVSDQLSISSAHAIERITVLSADGRIVKQLDVRASSARIDVKELTSGPYVLIAELENGTIAREHFIKQ